MAVSCNWDLAGSPKLLWLEVFHFDIFSTHATVLGQGHMQLLPSKEAKELFDLKLVQKTKHRILVEKGRGYACCPVSEIASTFEYVVELECKQRLVGCAIVTAVACCVLQCLRFGYCKPSI